jgi:hypothetical protein
VKSWPDLALFVIPVALCVTSIVLAEPPTTVAPWCPSVPCEPCDRERCEAMATAECEKFVGVGAVAVSWCQGVGR